MEDLARALTRVQQLFIRKSTLLFSKASQIQIIQPFIHSQPADY